MIIIAKIIDDWLILFVYAMLSALITGWAAGKFFFKRDNTAADDSSRQWRPELLLAAFVISVSLLLKMGSSSWAMKLRGLLGDLSATSILLISLALYTQISGRRFFIEKMQRAAFVIVILGLLIYPAEMGLISFGIYEYGYAWQLIAILAAASSWPSGKMPVVVMLSAAVLFYISPEGSNNFFDFIIDFPLWVIASIYLIKNCRRSGRIDKSQSIDITIKSS
jgi:hypothetical protein